MAAPSASGLLKPPWVGLFGATDGGAPLKAMGFQMNMKTLALAAFAATAIAGAAGATTLGDTVNSTYHYPTSSTFYEAGPTFTVASGVLGTQFVDGHPITESYSTSGGSETFTFTFDAVSFTCCVAFNGVVLTDLSGPDFGTITSVSGVPFANAFSTGGSLGVSWAGQTFSPGDSVSITLGTGVPEPAAWALMLMGFAGIGVMARRDRKVAAVA